MACAAFIAIALIYVAALSLAMYKHKHLWYKKARLSQKHQLALIQKFN